MLHAISKLPKHNIGDIEWILANEINADAFGANQSYHLLDLLLDWRRDVSGVLQHRTQVLEVQQKQSIFVGDFENDVEHAFLGVVQLKQAPKQQWAHFRNGRAHWVALLAEHVPKHHRRGFASEIVDLKLLRALEDFGIVSARLTEAREVAFHVRHEDRHAAGAEILSECL